MICVKAILCLMERRGEKYFGNQVVLRRGDISVAQYLGPGLMYFFFFFPHGGGVEFSGCRMKAIRRNGNCKVFQKSENIEQHEDDNCKVCRSDGKTSFYISSSQENLGTITVLLLV